MITKCMNGHVMGTERDRGMEIMKRVGQTATETWGRGGRRGLETREARREEKKRKGNKRYEKIDTLI